MMLAAVWACLPLLDEEFDATNHRRRDIGGIGHRGHEVFGWESAGRRGTLSTVPVGGAAMVDFWSVAFGIWLVIGEAATAQTFEAIMRRNREATSIGHIRLDEATQTWQETNRWQWKPETRHIPPPNNRPR